MVVLYRGLFLSLVILGGEGRELNFEKIKIKKSMEKMSYKIQKHIKVISI